MKQQELFTLLRDVYRLTGVRVTLYDRQQHCVAGDGGSGRAGYCAAVQTDPRGLARCFHSDRAAFAVVEKTGKPYVFTCPFGLFEAVVPLFVGERLLGFLFAGEAIDPSPAQRALALEEALPYVGKLHSREELAALVAELAAPAPAAREALLRAMEILGRYIVERGLLDERERDLAELVLIYLDRNFHRKLTLSELGLHFHCSTVTLTESFRRAFSTTIVEYLTGKRLEAAEGLLRNSPFSVETVAEKCGFSSTAYFSKVFKRRHGISPRFWREQHRAP